eukprot:803654_1
MIGETTVQQTTFGLELPSSDDSDIDIDTTITPNICLYDELVNDDDLESRQGVSLTKENRCRNASVCCLYCCLLFAVTITTMLIYLRIQSYDKIPPNATGAVPTTAVDIQFNLVTNTSIAQFMQHEAQIINAIEYSANQISELMDINVAHINISEFRNKIVVDVTMNIAVSDGSSAGAFDSFNLTNIILSELEGNQGRFSSSLTEQLTLTCTDLDIDEVKVNKVTEKYAIMVSASPNVDHNFVEEGIFIQIMNSERKWILEHLTVEQGHYKYKADDIWYVDGSCGTRGGITYVVSNTHQDERLEDILCDVYHAINVYVNDATETINDKINDASISLAPPSDIRVCVLLNGVVDSCASEQLHGRYMCVNRNNTGDTNGVFCS